MNLVYVVMIADEFGDGAVLDSVQSSVEKAERRLKEIDSSISGANAFYEEKELE